MQIYNFFDNGGNAIWILFALLPIVFIIITITLIVRYIKGKKRNAAWLYKLIGMAPIIIMLSITILISVYAFRIESLLLPSLTGKEKIVVGELTQVEVTCDDYRGETQYDITFNVNDFEFGKTINSYSEAEMTVISKNQGNQVKVTYMEHNDNWVVYEIETMSD